MPLPILFLALLAPPADPPPIMVTNTSPPVMAVPAPGRGLVYGIPEANDVPANAIEVQVRGGSELLWDAPLRVGRVGASVMQHVTQAEPVKCFVKEAADRWVQTSLSMSFSRRKLSNTPSGTFSYDIRVSWSRPAAADGCAREGGRSVEVRSTIDLAPGQQAVLRGDAGLEVRVKRR
jgi:hypothetical protein